METARSPGDFLDHTFFERGAYMTVYGEDRVILARGGDIRSGTSSSTTTNSFYLKDFYHDRYSIYSPAEFLEIKLSELKEIVSAWKFEPLKLESVENEDLLYGRDFTRLKNAFGPKLKKVVLVSREEFSLRGALNARRRFFARSVLFGTGMPGGIWFDDYGITGSTPELLFAVNDDGIQTFALAGTAPIDHPDELMNSAKDREEHDVVISDIKEKLSAFGKDISVGETYLHPYKNIVHLRTDIALKTTKTIAPMKLASALSPTAALGGYPQKNALEFLATSDYAARHPNRFFGSALGLTTNSVNQAIVMIRNIQWRGNRFIIESGGGVVSGSDLEKELNEIYLKRESIKGHYL